MTIIEDITSFLGKSLKNATQELERTARHNIQMRMYRFRAFIFRQAFILLFFALAFGCIFIAFIFAGVEYLHLTKTLSFLIVGILALFIAILLKALN